MTGRSKLLKGSEWKCSAHRAKGEEETLINKEPNQAKFYTIETTYLKHHSSLRAPKYGVVYSLLYTVIIIGRVDNYKFTTMNST